MLQHSPSDQIKIVRELMGVPYKLNARDPKEGFDCWSLTQYVQKELFGRNIPSVVIHDSDVHSFVRAALQCEQLCNWVTIDTPIHGCIVELCRGKVPHHCGTYLDIPELGIKGLLHSLSGAGVIFDPWITLKAAGWRRFIYNVPRNT